MQSEYEQMTVVKLKELAKDRGISLKGSLRKADIISTLLSSNSVEPKDKLDHTTDCLHSTPKQTLSLTTDVLLARFLSMTKTELQILAEHSDIKKDGVGWATCCPPTGNKADIADALVRHEMNNAPTARTAEDVDTPPSSPVNPKQHTSPQTPDNVLDSEEALEEKWSFHNLPRNLPEQAGMGWLHRLNTARSDWINVSKRDLRPERGVDTGQFIHPEYPPRVCVSFGGHDQRESVQKLHEGNHHVGADPWAVCDYVREALNWRAHEIFIIDEVSDAYPKWRWSYTWAQRKCRVQLFFVSKSWALSPYCLAELQAYVEMLCKGEVTGCMAFACLKEHFRISDPSEEQSRHIAAHFEKYAKLQEDGTLHVDMLKWLQYKQAELRKRLIGEHGAKLARERVPHAIFNLSAVWDWIESSGRKVKGDLKEMSECAIGLCQFLKETCPEPRGPEGDGSKFSMREEERAFFLARKDPEDHGFIDEDWRPEDSVIKALPCSVRLVKCCLPLPVRNPYRNDGHRLDLNTVSVENMVQKLPGIGEKLADKIRLSRPFQHVHELLKVEGIGNGKFATIHPFVTVGEEEPRKGRRVVYLAFTIDSEKLVGPFSDINEAVVASKQLVDG
ncbi:hypothetical protein CYMTET_9824 [Cymbomonas tetramitiformis]|uniref:Uncharacterized protein n=1 Tax=Cymbomonas tetramitiformis TaxID=36881 RepID=A0AAE0LER6_9CHLO|nr:hypothetical protein CYMTET_9824 [Cymbomonas tetramitiformis]